jgi:thiosulfate/3-mercaptopyruvate sulfurtransferase
MDAVARLLTDPATLARELAGEAPPLVIDARWQLGGPPGAGRYQAGHLPGAVFVDLDEDLSGPPGPGGRHPLPEAAAFQAAMRRAGVSAGRPVVVYDDGDSVAAARAWWTLRYFGHDQVRVLDGGFGAWAAAGRPVDTVVPDGRAGDFTAGPGGMPLLDAGGAAALARSGVLLDVRSAERYRGEAEPVDPVAGHIPGALSAPVTGSGTADGRFRPPAELAERFAALGASTGRPTGVYCGSGVTAAHEVLALELAGLPAALYVGSWSGWIADPGRPVATGPEPG